MQTEDLGHRRIAGIDAQGLLLRYVPPPGSDARLTPFTSELWCSDEIGVLVKQSVVREARTTETILQNIVRREPDPALFQIPSDYIPVQRETGRTTSH